MQPHNHREELHGAAQTERDRRPLVIALLLTASFLVVEVLGAVFTGSLALLADAGHLLADVAALGLALFAFWIAERPATPERTYGYYRVEVLAALANAATLVVLALYIFWEAYHRLSAPPPIRSLPMLGVAVAGLLANAASAWVLSPQASENLNIRGAFLHVVGDLLGSLGAVLAGLVMLLTGWFYADPIASVLIGLLVLYSGWHLLRESVDVLLEATPRGIDLHEIERALVTLPEVAGVHDLHVWTVTSGFLAMSGHLTVCAGDGHQVLVAATERLRERFGIGHVTLQLEAPSEEERIHQGCYFGADMTACVISPPHRTVTQTGHRD
ncbi:MAG: cation transporter [Chloroflexi bacterium]|nr:cation transporter [Chloroflexota bacterium]